MENTNNLQTEIVRRIKERVLSKLNFYEISIFIELAQPNPDVEGLLQMLRSQQKDNELVMNDIIGFDAGELLAIYIP